MRRRKIQNYNRRNKNRDYQLFHKLNLETILIRYGEQI